MRCSVVIPAYNAAKTIRRTLDTVLRNLKPDDEILIIDDGSTDDTAAICSGIDERIRVITTQNRGPAMARNRGIQEATGELVAFCDSDDLWHPRKLELQKQYFSENPRLGLCFTDYEVVDMEDNLIVSSARRDRGLPLEHSLASMLGSNPVMTSSAVVPRDILNEIGGFPQSYSEELKQHLATEDYETWISIAERHPVAMVPEVLATYRKMPTGLFMKRAGSRAASREVHTRRVRLIKSTSRRNHSLISPMQARRAIGDYYFGAGYSDRQRGFYASATRLFLMSLMSWPFRVKAYINLGLLPLLALKKFISNKPMT